MTDVILMLLALVLFGVLHSLTAGPPFKHVARTWLGERVYHGLYRLLYNTFSAITILPALALLVLRPGPVVWDAAGIAATLLTLAQIGSLIGLVLTALQFDVWRFAGLRQAVAYFAGDPLPLPPEPFVERGMYGLVRHPLYVFSILYIWTFPTMRAAQLAFAVGATLYFVIGAQFEERRLEREIGPAYRAYRCRVPFMIPFVGVTASCADAPDLARERAR